MKVSVRELTVGDILLLNDWRLHVIAVEHDTATAVLTAEFGFLLHFTRHETVDIVRTAGQPCRAGGREGGGRAHQGGSHLLPTPRARARTALRISEAELRPGQCRRTTP